MLPYCKVSPCALAIRSVEFDSLEREAAKLDQPFTGRWAHNIVGWKWRYYIKCTDYNAAASIFKQSCDIRHRQNVTTGYTRDTSSRMCGFNAMMKSGAELSQEKVQEVLRLVCRSLESLLWCRIRPEGIRDFLLVLEKALGQARDKTPLIRLISCIRESIIDGSSFLDPYRA